MITMSELEDTDKEIQEALSEYEIDRLSLEMRKLQAVRDYLKNVTGKPIGSRERRGFGYASIAAKHNITVEQLRGALKKYFRK